MRAPFFSLVLYILFLNLYFALRLLIFVSSSGDSSNVAGYYSSLVQYDDSCLYILT